MIDIWDNNVADPGSRQIGAEQIGQGPTLAAAIRDAGVRCETCRHWRDGRDERWPDYNGGYCSGPPCEYFSGDEYTGETPSNFFCASHSLLTQPSEGKGMKYKSAKTGNVLVVKGQMFCYRGSTFSGLVDEKANALYDNPDDSFNQFVGMPTALDRGLIVPITQPSEGEE